MGRFVRAVAPWVVSVALFLAAGELLARALRIVDRMNGFPRQLFRATDDPHLPYAMRPGVDVMVRGVRVQVNEHGMRGPSAPALPAAGVHRVLAVGDSATFGEGVPVEAAWPSVLQADLSQRAPGAWEVLNSGVEGWNTEAEVAYLQQQGLALQPETVVVAFNLNDFDAVPVLGPLGVLTLDHEQRVSTWSAANWSEFYLVLRWIFRGSGRVWVGDPSVTPPSTLPGTEPFEKFDQYVSVLRKQYYRNPNDGRWPTFLTAMHDLGAIAKPGRPRVLVVILPDGDQFGDAPDLTPQQKVLALCAETGLDCLDLYPMFRDGGGRPLFRDIMHPNAEGYRIVAREVAARLAPPAR